jgi:ketol-acid reductoisomerase
MTRGPKVIGEASKNAMRDILKNIQNGSFADEFMKEMKSGQKNLTD